MPWKRAQNMLVLATTQTTLFLVPYLRASRRVPDDSSKINSFFFRRLQTMLDVDYNITRSETASSAALDMDRKQLREL